VPPALVPVPATVDLLHRAKSASHTRLPNMQVASIERLEHSYAFREVFDSVVISCRVQLRHSASARSGSRVRRGASASWRRWAASERAAGPHAAPVDTIVPYQPEMLQPLVDLWRESFEHGVRVTDPHPIEEQRQYFVDHVAPYCEVSVVLRDAAIVGFVAVDAESISQLHVRVGCLRQDIGSRLVELAKSRSSWSLWLFTFARDAVARRFYEAQGFVAIAHGFEPTWRLEDVKYRWERPGNI
jgi:ribosomal protein S18 acetylase RimI-like enzyme